jgi:type IV secretion system protein TrbL
VGSATSAVAGDFFDSVARKFLEGVGKAVEWVVTFWVHIDTPVIDQDSGPVAALRGSLSWLVGAMGVVGVLLGLMRVVWSHRGDEASEVFKGLIRLVLATFMAVPVVALLTGGFDEFSTWILDQSAGGDLGAVVVKFGAFGALLGGLGTAIAFIVGVLGIFSALAQMFLMLVRGAMIIILSGVLPLAAAGSTTEAGKATFHKTAAWLLAFVLYKPVAAVVYAAAFFTAGQRGDVGSQLTGLFMIVMAVLGLPALMRLVTPAVGAVAAGGGGGTGLAAGAAMATGAIQVAGMSAGRSTREGGPGRAGPSGSGHGDGGLPGGTPRPSGGSPNPPPSGGTSGGGGGAGGGGGGAGAGAAVGAAAVGAQAVQAGSNGVRGGVCNASGAQEDTDR